MDVSGDTASSESAITKSPEETLCEFNQSEGNTETNTASDTVETSPESEETGSQIIKEENTESTEQQNLETSEENIPHNTEEKSQESTEETMSTEETNAATANGTASDWGSMVKDEDTNNENSPDVVVEQEEQEEEEEEGMLRLQAKYALESYEWYIPSGMIF